MTLCLYYVPSSRAQCTLYPSNAPAYDCLYHSTLESRPEQNTFGYAGLAWLTDNLCSDSFLPPGKIGEFMGFQFIRDSEPNGLGHNSQFSDYISQYIFTKLTDGQLALLASLANDPSHLNTTKFVLTSRADMSNSLRKLLLSSDKLSYLNLDAVAKVYGEIQQSNGLIILERAKKIGSIIRDMSQTLKAEIKEFFSPFLLNTSNLSSIKDESRQRFKVLGIPPGINTTLWNGLPWRDDSLMVTLGNQLMAWLTDDVGVYFAPEVSSCFAFSLVYFLCAPSSELLFAPLYVNITGIAVCLTP